MVTASLLSACADKKNAQSQTEDFSYSVEQFADLEILRYRVPGFESLSLRQKELVYYLDQNGKWNLPIRRTLEAVYTQYKGDKESSDFKALEKYLKQVWFANGIHHHYSTDKFTPEFSQTFFEEAVRSLPSEILPLQKNGNNYSQTSARLFSTPILCPNG